MRVRGVTFITSVVLARVLVAPLHAENSHDWYESIQQTTHLFNNVAPMAQMADRLSYFTNVFTAIGFAMVLIVAVRKVARARSGEESMGWVASTMMTVALMGAAPTISNMLFEMGDSVAKQSQYSPMDAVNTCWDAVLVILPGSDSPISQVLSDASATDVAKPTQVSNDNASFTKLAWSWMKIAWSTMTNALGNITAAFRSVVNSTVLVTTLSVPTMALVLSMFAIELGLLVREITHQCMQIFLPMMIAFLSFAPMRAAATNFILRYITIAFWPVAWALGNAIACSLLTSVIAWVVAVCHNVASAVSATPTNVGLLSAAAGFMNWTLLFTLVAAVAVCASLILASAIAAPRALHALVTGGSTFIGEQLGEAMRHFNTQSTSNSNSGGWIAGSSQGRLLADALTRIFSGGARGAGSAGSGTRMPAASLGRMRREAVELAAINDDIAVSGAMREPRGVQPMIETVASISRAGSMKTLERS